MRLRFLGKESTPNQSPTLYSSDGDTYVIQGWIVNDPNVLASLTVSETETVVEVPAKLLEFLAVDGLEGDVTNLVAPIVRVLDSGNLIIQGERVTDPDALSAMDIPDHETCVEVTKSAVRQLVGAA